MSGPPNWASTRRPITAIPARSIVGPQAQAILKPNLLRGPNDCLFSPAESVKAKRDRQRAAKTTPLSYGNREGTKRKRNPKRKPSNRYAVAAYGRAITRAAKKADVEHWSPKRPAVLLVYAIREFARAWGQWAMVAAQHRCDRPVYQVVGNAGGRSLIATRQAFGYCKL